MNGTLSRARASMRKSADNLDLPIKMVEKAAEILQKFSTLDPKMMTMGWKALVYKVIGLAGDEGESASGSEKAEAQIRTPAFITALQDFSADMHAIMDFVAQCTSDEKSDIRAYCAAQLAPLNEKEAGEDAKGEENIEDGEKKKDASEKNEMGILELLWKIGAADGDAKDDFGLFHLANQLLTSKLDAIEKW